MARTTASEADALEAALLAAGRDPDLAFDIWDIWQNHTLAAALAALEKPMDALGRLFYDLDRELREMDDADVKRLAEYRISTALAGADAPPAIVPVVRM